MRNKDTGEFELVVGDKQLLSAFFIGVLLLAVVFAMGYVLGQSSPKSAKVPQETAAIPSNTANPPVDTHPPANTPAPAPPAAEPAAAAPPVPADSGEPAAAPPVEAPPQPTTVPARDSSQPAPPPKSPPAPDLPNPTYWQVLAGSQTSADALSQTLRGQGFPVTTRPGPNNLTLVWVGPFNDKDSLARAKRQLEDAGIANLIRKP